MQTMSDFSREHILYVKQTLALGMFPIPLNTLLSRRWTSAKTSLSSSRRSSVRRDSINVSAGLATNSTSMLTFVGGMETRGTYRYFSPSRYTPTSRASRFCLRKTRRSVRAHAMFSLRTLVRTGPLLGMAERLSMSVRTEKKQVS